VTILTNMRGRVEADPMRIPAPLRSSSDGSDPFAAMLEQAVQRAADQRSATAPAVQQEAAPVDEPVTDEAAELPPERREQPDVEFESDGDTGDGEPSSHPHAAGPEATETLRRGESERQPTAGKGPDSPRTSPGSGTDHEPLLTGALPQGEQGRGVVVGPSSQGVTAIAATGKAGEAQVRGFENGQARGSTPTRAPAVAAGYRTDNAASAQLLEHARDSVFKQILMQLNGDGGEMRVRLQPPDLGELDLRLVVEHGNRLSLSIGAERADMTALLQKHLDELKQTLQSAGLEVTDAHVYQRDAHSARDGGRSGSQTRHDSHDEAADAAAAMPQLRRSYVTAEGLDFWA
jgi:hypothetical protein